jgi:hypothetical protein
MADFIFRYPYLVFSQFMILVLLIPFFLFPRQRTPMLVSTVLASPLALASLAFVPEYWTPGYLFVFLGVGLEDVLFAFYIGGVAWLLSSCIHAKRIQINFRKKILFRRYLLVLVFGLLVGSIFFLLGFRHIDIAFIVMGLWTGVLLYWRPSLWPLAVSGAVSACFFTLIMYQLNLLIWSQLPKFWNWPNLWGVSMMGIPLEEYVFLILYFPAWTLTTSFMLNVRLGSSKSILEE